MKWWAVFNDLATCFSQDGTINSSETWQQWPVAVLSVKDPTADTAHAQLHRDHWPNVQVFSHSDSISFILSPVLIFALFVLEKLGESRPKVTVQNSLLLSFGPITCLQL